MPALFMPTSWNNRGNVDSGNWDTRAIAGQSVILGGGGSSVFSIVDAVNPFVFYRPRYLRYGTISGGRDQWDERANSDTGWVLR